MGVVKGCFFTDLNVVKVSHTQFHTNIYSWAFTFIPLYRFWKQRVSLTLVEVVQCCLVYSIHSNCKKQEKNLNCIYHFFLSYSDIIVEKYFSSKSMHIKSNIF